MKSILVWLTLLIAFTSTFTPALRASDTAEYGSQAGTIPVPDGLSRKEVRRAIIEGSAHRGWILKAQDDDKVVLILEKSGWLAKITLLYDKHEIQLYSNSTHRGETKVPSSWIHYLTEDIGAKLRSIVLEK